MASFTDNPQALSTFNPYIQQLPVEAMVKVGMQKQQQYDEGIQKIQTNIDNIAGLDIYKDSDKAYLQTKINELGNNLRIVGAGDFSDFQLVNSVNGMTNQIAKDENVRNAVGATANAKKELAYMEEERKKGNTHPANEYVFKKKFSAWADNGEIGESFNSKYDPYFDVFKFAKETFAALGDDSMTFDQIFQTGADGKPLTDKNGRPILSHYMKRLEKEGKFPEKVKETLNQIFSDGRVGKQLSIEGQYNFSSLDETELKGRVIAKKDDDLSKYTDALYSLNLQKSMGINVDDKIDTVRDRINKINSSYDELLESKDLDAIRGSLYKQDVYDRYTDMFSTLKTKELILESPAFKQEFELNKEAQRRAEKARDQALDNLKFQREEYWKAKDEKWKQKNYDLEVVKTQISAGKKGPGKDNTTGGLGGDGTDRPDDTERMFPEMADDKYTSAANAWSGAQDMFIYETMFNNKANNDIIKQIMLDAPGDTPLSKGAAINIFLKQQAKKDKKAKGDIALFRTLKSAEAKELMDTNGLKNGDKIKNFSSEKEALAAGYKLENDGKYHLRTKGLPPNTRDLYNDIQSTYNVYKQENAFRIERQKASVKTIEAIGLDKDFANLKPETITYRGQKLTLSKQNQIDIATYLAGKTNLVRKHWSDPSLVDAANEAKRRLDKSGLGEVAERYLQRERLDSLNPITRTVGSLSELGSSLKDLITEGSTNALDSEKQAKYYKLAEAIADKSYGKVVTEQAKLIKMQYNINPNKGFTLTTGDAGDDRFTQAQLTTFVSAFKRKGDNQNLASDEEFEAFQTNLKDEKTFYTITSETNERGQPVWAVEDNNGGRMVLNPDQSAKLGYNTNDIYEADSVMYARNKINQYGGKTSIGDPKDIYTYKNSSDYHYDNDAGDFKNVKNPNYTVRANVAEYKTKEGTKYYPYIYVSDGMTERVIPLNSEDNLSKIDFTIKNINDADVKAALK